MAPATDPQRPPLKVPAANLTELAQKNNGKYPAPHVSSVVRGEADLPAHGTRICRCGGPLFRRISQGNEGAVQQRIANLNRCIESVQKN